MVMNQETADSIRKIVREEVRQGTRLLLNPLEFTSETQAAAVVAGLAMSRKRFEFVPHAGGINVVYVAQEDYDFAYDLLMRTRG